MKKLLILSSLIMFALSGYTRDVGISWLETGNSKLDCRKIHLGYKNARIVLSNGQKKTVPVSLINSYSVNGKVFTRLPIYKNGQPTGETEFMELIKTIGDLCLYKLDYQDTNMWDKMYLYFLYNGNKLYLALDEKSLPNICDHYGIAYTYK